MPNFNSKVWETNMRRLEELLKSQVLRPRILPDKPKSRAEEVKSPQLQSAKSKDTVPIKKELEVEIGSKDCRWVHIEVVIWRVLGLTLLCAMLVLGVPHGHLTSWTK